MPLSLAETTKIIRKFRNRGEIMLVKKLLIWAVLSLAAAAFVNGQSAPRDVRDLVGARASSGETQLTRRGYKFIKTEEGDDRKWSNWWKKSTSTCITVTTVNGRYDAIMKTPAADCSTGDDNNNTNSDKLDVSDLVGARASSGESQLTQRGYRFIKTENGDDRKWSNWWNRSTRTCITVTTVNGRYDAITKTTASDCNISGNNNGGGNGGGATAKVDVSDLVGARASSGESEMKSRGFRLVDTMKMANTSYTIWWRQPSRQCIQVATANGRYDSLTDIQTHPKCR